MARDGLLQLTCLGMGGKNKSMGRCPRPSNPIRLMYLGHLALKVPSIFYGGSMTWDELGSLKIPWGDNETVIYDTVQAGWTYVFDVGLKRFTVTDNNGTATVYNGITTISDLCISWDILESPQFSIVINGTFENIAFLIAWKYRKWQVPPGEDPGNIPARSGYQFPYFFSYVDQYLSENGVSSKYYRLLDISPIDGVTDGVTVSLDASGYAREVLLAKIKDLSADCNFPANYFEGKNAAVAAKQIIEKQAIIESVGEWLMIAAFASIMNASKPVYEPWMLWHLWQWLGQGTVVIKRERVFDLSPRWGG